MAQSREYKNYLRRLRYKRPEVKAKHKEYMDRYIAKDPEGYAAKRKAQKKDHYENNKSIYMQYACQYNSKSCKDPVVGDVCRYNTLVKRKRNHPDLYEGVSLQDCLNQIPQIRGVDEELKKEYNL